ncbi:hypothetical protein EBZ38_03245 [bacterium]|nr:hypothetical protein [bacterium]NDC93977.1 hypothetical protein [bacterium]NDD83282.1 hypothetical protein [bacterium]
MQDEKIAQPQATSQESQAQAAIEPQTQEVSTLGQSEAVEEANSIPQKFVGKSPMEIIQAYRELEKDRGRLASELGSTRKERETLEEQYKALERERIAQMQMPTQRPPRAVQLEEEVDPVSVFESKFEEDPKEAIKLALKGLNNSVSNRMKQQSLQQIQAEGADYYWRQKKENPDYSRREPLMQQLAAELQDVVRPEFLNSAKVLKALDLMSRGMDVDYYSKQAVERAQKGGLSVRSEKQRAQSESAVSQGDTSVPFEKLSLDEMRRALGRSDD